MYVTEERVYVCAVPTSTAALLKRRSKLESTQERLGIHLARSDCSLFHNCVGQETPQCDEGTGVDPTQPWAQPGHKTGQHRGFAAFIL